MESLRVDIEEYSLNKQELRGVQKPYHFSAKYNLSLNRHENLKEIEGKRFWVSCLQGSRGNSIQRNQAPILVEISVCENGKLKMHKVGKSGKTLKQEIKLYDNAGNGLYICETEKQAKYMYNSDLNDLLREMDRRIEEIQDTKKRLFSLKQNV